MLGNRKNCDILNLYICVHIYIYKSSNSASCMHHKDHKFVLILDCCVGVTMVVVEFDIIFGDLVKFLKSVLI